MFHRSNLKGEGCSDWWDKLFVSLFFQMWSWTSDVMLFLCCHCQLASGLIRLYFSGHFQLLQFYSCVWILNYMSLYIIYMLLGKFVCYWANTTNGMLIFITKKTTRLQTLISAKRPCMCDWGQLDCRTAVSSPCSSPSRVYRCRWSLQPQPRSSFITRSYAGKVEFPSWFC